MIWKDRARIKSGANQTSGRARLANQNFYGPVNLRQLGSQERRRSGEDWSDGRTPTMLKTDQPSSYVSYGEEYEKQRTRAGHLASERGGEGGRAMRRLRRRNRDRSVI